MKYLMKSKFFTESKKDLKQFEDLSIEKFVIKKNKFQLYLGEVLVSETYYTIESADEWFSEKYLTLYSLRTIEQFRSKGYAIKLLEMIFKYIKKEGIRIITLIVDKENYKAVRLYFKIGFEVFMEYDSSYSLVKKI